MPTLTNTRRYLVKESFALILLTLPIVVTVSFQMLINFTNTYLMSQLGVKSLAIGGLSITFFIFALAAGFGLFTSFTAHISQAYKKSDFIAIARLLSDGFAMLFVFSLISFLCVESLICLLGFIVFKKAVTIELLQLEAILMAGLFPTLLFSLLRAFTFCLSKPIAVMLFTLPFIVFNYFLCEGLMYGFYGFAHLGIFGVALGTTLISIAMCFLFILYLLASTQYRAYFKKLTLPSLAGMQKRFSESWPMAAAYLLLFGILLIASFLSSHVGIHALAENQVVMQVVDVIFMIGLGLSHAVLIRTGYAISRPTAQPLWLSQFASLMVATLFSTIIAILLIYFKHSIAMLFLKQHNELLSTTETLIVIAAFFNFFRVFQANASAALIHFNQARYCLSVYTIAYWLIALSLMLLAFFDHTHAVIWIWLALTSGAIIAAIVLNYRLFYFLTATSPLNDQR